MAVLEKIIIIGGGPAGLSAALRIKQITNISPVIYELRDEPKTLYGGAIGIPSNGLRLLNRLGIYQEIAALATSTRSVILRSTRGRIIGELDLVNWSEKQTGFGYIRVKRADVMDVLLNAAKTANISIVHGKRLERIEENDDRVRIYFSDGDSDACDFLLGCDGIHSSVRTKYVDPKCTPVYSGISNIGSIVSTSNLPLSINDVDTLNATMTQDGVLVLIPTNASRESIYWFFSREVALPEGEDALDGWEERRKAHVETMKSNLIEILGNSNNRWVNMVKDVLHKTEVIKFYPNYKLPPGGKWSKGRVLLLGDAAHAMPPHASQGYSMALEDAFLLANLLKVNSTDISSVIRRFEESRRGRLQQVLETAESRGYARRRIPRWQLRVRECVLMGLLGLYGATGLSRLGFGQKLLTYDIEKDC